MTKSNCRKGHHPKKNQPYTRFISEQRIQANPQKENKSEEHQYRSIRIIVNSMITGSRHIEFALVLRKYYRSADERSI